MPRLLLIAVAVSRREQNAIITSAGESRGTAWTGMASLIGCAAQDVSRDKHSTTTAWGLTGAALASIFFFLSHLALFIDLVTKLHH